MFRFFIRHLRYRKSVSQHAFLAIALLILGMSLPAQTAVNLPGPDIYKHFVGRWIGDDAYVKDGVMRHVPVLLVITEEKNRKSMRMDYTYDSKGSPDFDKTTKYVTLDVQNHQLRIRFQGDREERYTSDDLVHFAESGLGSFIASAPAKGEHRGGTIRVLHKLTKTTLIYTWEAQYPGMDHFKTISTFSFQREGTNP